MSLKRPTKAQGTTQGADYTPVIFPLEKNIPFAPSIASGSSSNKAPNGLSYMERLAQKHKALARMAREETRSIPQDNQNINDIANEERASALRELVREAMIKADGNTADGKYIFVTQLLRLNSTSGRNGRWSGVRTDLSPPEELKGSGLGWINAKTEAEWKEWERKYEAERRVKDKVENWKKTVEPPSKDPSLQESLESPVPKALSRSTGSKASVNLVSVAADPLKSSTPFGFSVVKRHKNVAGKPSGSGKAKEPAESPADDAPKPARNAHKKHIADLLEHSFIPPSFPSSQLMTSTPKHAARPSSKPRKPDPIPHIAEPSSSEISIVPETSQQPPLSPRVTKTYGRHNPSPGQPLEASASLPAIPTPSTPTRNRRDNHHPHTEADDSLFNTNNKRVFASPTTPDNQERVLKRARTLSEFPHSPSTPPPGNRRTPQQARTKLSQSPRTPTNVNMPTAALASVAVPAAAAMTSRPLSLPPSSSPKKQVVPTLTELLASAKKGKKRFTAAKPPSKGKAKETKETPPIVEDEEIVEDVQSDKVSPRRAASPVTPFLFPRAAALVEEEKEDDSVHANFHDLSEGGRDLPPFDPYVALDPEPLPYDDPSLIPVDAMSPAKSLSSLAGSDSEEEDELAGDDSLGFSFKPLITSTQRGPFASTSTNDGDRGPFSASNGDGGIIGTNESQPAPHDFSQGTKDSWDSIYAPPSGPKSKSRSKSSSEPEAQPQPQPRHYKLPPSSGVSTNPFAYNSQFATGVAKSVYDVDKLLEQDVELAYSGWIQDPYADENEDDGGYGQNGLEPDSSP